MLFDIHFLIHLICTSTQTPPICTSTTPTFHVPFRGARRGLIPPPPSLTKRCIGSPPLNVQCAYFNRTPPHPRGSPSNIPDVGMTTQHYTKSYPQTHSFGICRSILHLFFCNACTPAVLFPQVDCMAYGRHQRVLGRGVLAV